MFGRRDTEKRSLEEMFKPKDEDIVEEGYRDDFYEESEKEEKSDNFVNEPIKPLDCFGMEEEKTEKWLIKCVRFWYCVMSFVWFLFGALTFAPVIYISNKVNVIFKDKKKSFLFSSCLYGFVALLVFLLASLK